MSQSPLLFIATLPTRPVLKPRRRCHPATPWRGTLGALCTSLVLLAATTSALASQPSRRQVSLEELKSHCAPHAGKACEISISSPIATDLQGVEQLPPRFRVTFSDKGSWTLNGGTLDFLGSNVSASGDRQIFFGSGAIRGLSQSRPEWFAQPDGDAYPSSALRLAYAATVRTGTILLGDRAYLSPFFDARSASCGPQALSFDSPRLLLGAQRPVPDSTSHPTRLVNGSVIRGEICGAGAVRAAHLGVDAGPYVVSRNFHGKGPFGIQIIRRPMGTVSGTSLDDVSVLTTAVQSQHSVLIEGQQHVALSHLWIWTLGGTHGLVMKSFNSTVEDFHCSGASSDCLILKSDYATDHQGQASYVRLSEVYLEPIARPGDTGGIVLDARWDSLRHVDLSDVHEDGLTFGIAGADSFLHSLADVHIQGWTATDMLGPCLTIEGGRRITLYAVSCTGPAIRPTTGFLHQSRRFRLKPYLRMLWTQFITILQDGSVSERAALGGIALLFAAAVVGLGKRCKSKALILNEPRLTRPGRCE